MINKITGVIFLTAACGMAQADVVLDGVFGGGDAYSTTESVSWFNGHRTDDSAYGDFENQFASTNIRYGTGTLAGDASGTLYFFLQVEAPLYAKNMIWQDTDWNSALGNTDENAGLTENDVNAYRTHHETHHNPFSMKLDFRGATGSEKMVFVNSNGDGVFEADLAGDVDNSFGLIDSKDSVDYLFDNGISTEGLSLARNTKMSYEFQFALNAGMNDQLLDYVRNGIEFHLSPERGLSVPTPGSLAILGLGGLTMTRRRRA